MKFKVEVSPQVKDRKSVIVEVELRCRTSDQSFIFTFLDFDHTVSYLYNSSYDEEKENERE